MKRTLTAAALLASSAGAMALSGTANAATTPELPVNLPNTDNSLANTTYHGAATLASARKVVGDVVPAEEVTDPAPALAPAANGGRAGGSANVLPGMPAGTPQHELPKPPVPDPVQALTGSSLSDTLKSDAPARNTPAGRSSATDGLTQPVSGPLGALAGDPVGDLAGGRSGGKGPVGGLTGDNNLQGGPFGTLGGVLNGVHPLSGMKPQSPQGGNAGNPLQGLTGGGNSPGNALEPLVGDNNLAPKSGSLNGLPIGDLGSEGLLGGGH